jgi:hypothetical protein
MGLTSTGLSVKPTIRTKPKWRNVFSSGSYAFTFEDFALKLQTQGLEKYVPVTLS